MLFAKPHRAARALLPLAFFGMLISLLIVGESFDATQASAVTVQHGKAVFAGEKQPKQELPRCKQDKDCPLPTTYCPPSGKCTALENPTCDCGQPQVLRCYDQNEKARFMYCQNGCVAIDGGAICQ